MSAPPAHRVQSVVDDFAERLILDCRGPEACRRILTEDADDRENRRQAGTLARRILAGRRGVLGQDNVGQPGERYVKETLIWPLLDALGYEYRIESYLGESELRGDFRTVNTRRCLLGEAKAPNDYAKTAADLREDTRDGGADVRFALVTDGFNWRLLRGNTAVMASPDVVTEIDIRSLVASRLNLKVSDDLHRAVRHVDADATVEVNSRHLRERDSTKVAQSFADRFSKEAVDEAIEGG